MENKERHGCVTAWLILMLVTNSIVAIIYFFARESVTDNLPGNVSESMILLLGLLSISNVGFAILLFRWKRWAFYGFVVTSLGAFLINLDIGLGIGQSLLGLVGIAILYGILQIKKHNTSAWDHME